MRIDFSAWVSDNLTVEHKSGDEWTCVCPSCGKTKLAINVQKQAFQCWTCKLSGRRASSLVAAVLGVSEAQATAHIATNSLHLAQTRIKSLEVRKESRSRLPQAPLPPGTQPLQGSAKKYAARRRITKENAILFGLSSIFGDGSGSKADRILTGRLLIPVYDLRKRLVYWVARAVDDHPIKTINLPSTDRHSEWGLVKVEGCATRSDVLVGVHLVSKGSRVIIVEGPMDAAVCGAGFVATMGASMSQRQASLIIEAGASEAIILYDPDEAGEKGAAQAYKLLSPFIPTKVATCPHGFDPADLGRSRALAIADKAESNPLPVLSDTKLFSKKGKLRPKIGFIGMLKK